MYDWVETTETGEILHPSSILSKEVDKLKKYVTSGDIEVSEISLEYMLFADKNETYDIKPVWVVYYYQNQLVTGENSYTQKWLFMMYMTHIQGRNIEYNDNRFENVHV